MGLDSEIKSISCEQLIETMQADLSEFEINPNDHISFAAYLIQNYPDIYEFIHSSAEAMPFSTDEESTVFVFGAAFATAALVRCIESLSLPDPK